MGTRTYDVELECGCMFSNDKGGGMIPCSSGYYEMTPPEFQGDKPDNYDIHRQCMKNYYGYEIREKKQVNLDPLQECVIIGTKFSVFHNGSGEIFLVYNTLGGRRLELRFSPQGEEFEITDWNSPGKIQIGGQIVVR